MEKVRVELVWRLKSMKKLKKNKNKNKNKLECKASSTHLDSQWLHMLGFLHGNSC